MSKKKPSQPTSLTIPQALHWALQHYQAGRLSEAEALYQQILQTQPETAGAYHGLGLLASQAKNCPLAIELFQKAIQLQPNIADYYQSLGSILAEQSNFAGAVTCYEKAIALNPNNALTYYKLGWAFKSQNKHAQAVLCFRRVIALDPNIAEAYNGLGNALRFLGKIEEAIANYQKTLELEPQHEMAHNNIACALQDKGLFDQAIPHFREALHINPNYQEAYSNLLFALNYVEEDPHRLFAEHQGYHQQLALPLMPIFENYPNSCQNNRKLKIGYVSRDFKKHSVAYFIEPILAHHNHKQFEITCYYDDIVIDDTTQRLQAHADHWKFSANLSHANLAELIKTDQIDILIDLGGHAGDRLLTFAQRAAPVQITYLGYPTSSGLTAIDYRLSDHHVDPQGETEIFNSEKLLRMPHSYFCYQPYWQSPPVTPLPALETGILTLGCFNNHTKVTAQLLDLWAEIIKKIPNSRLLLKSSTQHFNDPEIVKWVSEKLFSRGLTPEQIHILPSTRTTEEHLKYYQQIDIALDTYPYNGATTTCEALWMGIPVISWSGKTHASRMGLSLLNTVGLGHLVAKSAEEYLNIVINLTSDLNQLQDLRKNLRSQVSASPLTQAAQFTAHLETLYQNIWETWCQQHSI